MDKKEFTIKKEYENIAMLQNNHFRSLKNCFKTFKHRCENNEMLPPEKFSEIFKWEENKETKKIEIRFVYNYINEDKGQICKTNITSSFPFVFGLNWHIQQPFLIMQEMYINKLNGQILNKLNN